MYFAPSSDSWVHSALPLPGPGQAAYTYVYRLYADDPNSRFEAMGGEVSVVALEILPPGTIDRFEIESQSESLVALSWDHTILPENHIDHFELRRVPAWSTGSDWKEILFVAANYNDTDVEPGTSYSYFLRAVNDTACESSPFYSNIALTATNGQLPGATSSLVSIAPATGSEGADGAITFFDFVVSLDLPNQSDVSVDFTTVEGTAQHHQGGFSFDYAAQSGRLTIPAGSTTGTIRVAVEGDNDNEADEQFTVELSNPSGNAVIAVASAEGTILNDDAPRPTIGLTNLSYFAFEGSPDDGDGVREMEVGIRVTTGDDLPTQHSVSVDYATANGTATAGSDYTAISGTLVVPVGSFSGQEFPLPVALVGDAIVEADESFTIELSNRSANSRWGIRSATATIQNDDFF